MRYLTTLIFIFCSLHCYGQACHLLAASDDATTRQGEAIIYGNFIQRLGFNSAGYEQEITLVEVYTRKTYSFIVKEAFCPAKENNFVYHIKPGTYAILNYQWAKEMWYGPAEITEHIYKGIDSRKKKKVNTGPEGYSQPVSFTFTILPNTINYIGNWHFDTGIVSFSNDKEQSDQSIGKKYTSLDLSSANIVLPD